MSTGQLDGKVAVITGGTRGLGYQMAMAFAEAGAEVMVASRKDDACKQAADEITQKTGRRAVGHPCHVGHWDEVDGLVDAAYDTFGHVDILVNNAGMSPLYPKLSDVSEELWDKVIGVNLKGPFRLSALCGERMKADRGGSIINISSIASTRATPRELPYGAAKAGLNILTQGFALALGPEVRVNCISAGPFLTDISKAWDMEGFNQRAKSFPLRRGGQPEEIVGTALYLASDASSYTTGVVIPVDGGASLA